MVYSKEILHGQNRQNRHCDGSDRIDGCNPCAGASFMGNPALLQAPLISDTDSSLTIEWLNSEEAARLLRISVKALRNMTSNGQLPFYKLGRRNRYRKDELESLLRSQKRGQYGN